MLYTWIPGGPIVPTETPTRFVQVYTDSIRTLHSFIQPQGSIDFSGNFRKHWTHLWPERVGIKYIESLQTITTWNYEKNTCQLMLGPRYLISWVTSCRHILYIAFLLSLPLLLLLLFSFPQGMEVVQDSFFFFLLSAI